MKVLMINGSPHKEGNTYIALHEMEKSSRKHRLKRRFFISETRISGAVSPAASVIRKGPVPLMIW